MAQFLKGTFIYLTKQIWQQKSIYLMCESVQNAGQFLNTPCVTFWCRPTHHKAQLRNLSAHRDLNKALQSNYFSIIIFHFYKVVKKHRCELNLLQSPITLCSTICLTNVSLWRCYTNEQDFRISGQSKISTFALSLLTFSLDIQYSRLFIIGTWWCLGWDDYFQPEGRGFDSRSSRHVGTSPLPAVACALRRETPIQYPCCSRERLLVEMNEWIWFIALFLIVCLFI